MKLIRTQNNVPEVYVNASRDFQLLCRLYDCLINGVKFDIESIGSITDTYSCDARLLQLLQSKLGFFSNVDITDDDLRFVLRAFPYIMKNKGSKRAIEQALYVFLKLRHLKTEVYVQVINEDADNPYTVRIGIRASMQDTSVLDEILKYILPSGCIFEYVFYVSVKDYTPIEQISSAGVVFAEDYGSAQVRHNDLNAVAEEADTEIGNLTIGAVDTTEVLSVQELESIFNREENETLYTGYYNSNNGKFYFAKVVTVADGDVRSVVYDDEMEKFVYSSSNKVLYQDKDTEKKYKWNGIAFVEYESSYDYSVSDGVITINNAPYSVDGGTITIS